MDLPAQLKDTWDINQRINLYLLEAIPPEALPATPTGLKGRSVGEIFAHLHNVRLMWLDAAAPDLLDGLSKIPTRTQDDKAAITHALLPDHLAASAAAVNLLLEHGLTAGRIKGFKPHPAAFLGYLLAHEGYHRGEICMTLTEAGHRLPDQVLYGLWEWGVR